MGWERMYEDQIETAEEELKRADHLVFVSLKYTRTCDIMKNAIKRMISAYELSMEDFLKHKRKEKHIDDVPVSAKERAVLVRKILGNSAKNFLALYNLLKQIDKSDYSVHDEFRKNVILRIKGKKKIDVKVDDLYNYLSITKDFVSFIKIKVH